MGSGRVGVVYEVLDRSSGRRRALKTLRNLTGAWIKSQKVVIEKGKITEYRVLMKVSFILQDK